MGKLTDIVIRKPLAPGRYGDGNGLYLLVGPTGGKSWVFRFKANNRERGMGLGPYPLVTLAEAREKALECRKVKSNGGDPLATRHAERDERRAAIRRATSFQDCAEQYLETHEVAWKNPKHRQQWRYTLSTYAYPKIGSTAVGAIDVPSVLSVIQPLWPSRPETASRLRGRIESILDWARVKGLREGENPARWKGNLDYALPKKSKVRKTKHFAALPFAELPTFIVQLRQTHGVTARALEFLILTATRTTEVLMARWAEVDLQNEIWTIPAERMKAGREHRVPLSKAAISLLRRAKDANADSDFVFSGKNAAEPLSNMAALMLVRRLRPGITVHGFRSTFRDWAAETTTYSNEVVEMALAHTISNAVEAAYRRGDLFDKRRSLMEEWSRYLLSGTTVLVESQNSI